MPFSVYVATSYDRMKLTDIASPTNIVYLQKGSHSIADIGQSDVIRTFFTADIGQSDVIGIDDMGGSETTTLSVTALLSA